MVTDNTNIADMPEFDDTPDVGLNPTEGIAPVAEEVVSDTTAPAVETPAPTAAVTPEPTPLPNSDQAQLQQQMAQMQQQQAEMERDRTIKQLEQEALQMEQRLSLSPAIRLWDIYRIRLTVFKLLSSRRINRILFRVRGMQQYILQSSMVLV